MMENIKVGIRITITFVLVAMVTCALCQVDSLVQSYDSGLVHNKLLNIDLLEDMRSDDTYAYIIEQSKEEGLLGKIWSQIKAYVASFFKSTARATGSNAFNLLFVVFAIGTLVYFFLRSQRQGFFQKSKKPVDFTLADGMTIEDTADIPQLLSDALTNLEYKKAVQLMYVQSILLLGEANRVDVKKFKTNAVYYSEIENRNEKEVFADLTKLYEYIQFGDFEATQEDVNVMQHNLGNLKTMLAG